MTDPRLHLWPKGADVAEVKRIVESLDLGYIVKPFWWTPESEDVERVLVLADGFEGGTITDYIYPKNPELLKESIEWAIGLRKESRGARLVQQAWDRIFGSHVKIGQWEDINTPGPESWRDL